MSNRKWSLGLLVLFLLFTFLLLQFVWAAMRIRGLVEPLEASHTGQVPQHLRHVVLISQELDNPFWRSVELGAREAAKQTGMELEYSGPFRINPAEQIKLLDQAIAAKADAVILQGIGDLEHRRLIDKAAGLGIPVITVDTDEPGSRRLSYVGTDNAEAGKRMGELVAQQAGGAGRIGVLIGSAEAANQQLRLEGFREVIGQQPGMSIADVRSSNISRLQAAQQAEEMLRQQPQLDIIVGFSALDGIGILEAAGRLQAQAPDLHIFAFDDLTETVEGIKQGHIAATIVQQPHSMGYEAITLLDHYFHGNKPQEHHFTPISVMDRNTFADSSEAAEP